MAQLFQYKSDKFWGKYSPSSVLVTASFISLVGVSLVVGTVADYRRLTELFLLLMQTFPFIVQKAD